MAHHGDDSEALDLMRKMMAEQFRQAAQAGNLTLGATGQFPEGKLNDDDEGEIRIAIGATGGKVVIDFGKPVAWLGFTTQQAREIAASLLEKADALEAR